MGEGGDCWNDFRLLRDDMGRFGLWGIEVTEVNKPSTLFSMTCDVLKTGC